MAKNDRTTSSKTVKAAADSAAGAVGGASGTQTTQETPKATPEASPALSAASSPVTTAVSAGTPKRGKDYRSRYGHTAYGVSNAGISQEAGRKTGPVLSGTMQMMFEVQIPVGTDGTYEFTLAPGLMGSELIWVKVPNSVTGGTVEIIRTGDNGSRKELWIAAAGPEDPTPVPMNETYNFENLDGNRTLRVVVSGVTADPNDVVIAGLLLTPTQSDWK